MNTFLFTLVFSVAESLCQGQDPLERLNIDLNAISTSGISSGACMATQFHVAYSASIMGVGMVAGAPYWCAQGSAITATGACMTSPANVDVMVLQDQTATYASSGDIDNTNYLNGHAVWVFAGTQDSVVVPGEAINVQDFYSLYTTNIRVVDTVDAEHTFPTVDMGNACLVKGDPYIGKCNYDGAYELLNYIYGGSLERPDRNNPPELAGTFRTFDQREFFYTSLPAQSSMDTTGFIYTPSACVSGITRCKLHVVFHGCSQQRELLGDQFAMESGYNEVGELNNIVMIYPQTVASVGNTFGCWDWWGYTINRYATKGANQPLAVARMVDTICGTAIAPQSPLASMQDLKR